MTRNLGELSATERERIVSLIHKAAGEAGWHHLNVRQRSELYREWEGLHELSHQAVKDGVMKGFDVAQRIPPSGEAAVHVEVERIFNNSLCVPYWDQKVRLWAGRAVADFVLGFNRDFLTHTIELESARTWRQGLMQALWYKSAYFQESRVQAIPTLLLFGDVTHQRWDEMETTCLDQRALLLTHNLIVDGEPAQRSLESLIISPLDAF